MADRLPMRFFSPASSPIAQPISTLAFWDSCKFAVLGVGSRSYGSNFRCQGLLPPDACAWSVEILPLCQGDVEVGDLDVVFEQWSSSMVGLLKRYSGGENGEFLIGSRLESQRVSEYESFGGSEEEEVAPKSGVVLVDLEDFAGKGPSRSSSQKNQFGASKFKPTTSTNGEQNGKKEMVTPII